MINIWDFQGARNVRIVDISGEEYVGNVVSVDDVDEMCDATEDEIVIETNSGVIYGIPQSQVKSIEKL